MKVKVLAGMLYFPFAILTFFALRLLDSTSQIFEQITYISILYIVLVFSYGIKKRIINKDFIIFVLVAVLAFSQLFINFQLNIDRSRSFYVLSWVKNYEIKKKNLRNDLLQIKSDEKKSISALVLRIDEQISRGLIKINTDNFLELSYSGEILLIVSETSARIFNLEGWEKNSK